MKQKTNRQQAIDLEIGRLQVRYIGISALLVAKGLVTEDELKDATNAVMVAAKETTKTGELFDKSMAIIKTVIKVEGAEKSEANGDASTA